MFYYGAHLSIKNGIVSAIQQINEMNGNMIQIFVSNPMSVKMSENKFTDKEYNSIKNKLKNMLEYVYELDVLNTSKLLVQSGNCCYVKFTNKFTKMIDMGHIQLDNNQVRNNMSLSKNIIITGPNAAGKTTYIKAIFTNTILSQTLGIACAKYARIKIVHAIGSFIRISDNLGIKSLFEAEVERCNELIKYAEEK